jgi:hypothetical protein
LTDNLVIPAQAGIHRKLGKREEELFGGSPPPSMDPRSARLAALVGDDRNTKLTN